MTDRPRLWRDIDVADTATGGLHDAVTTSKNWQERQMFNDYAEQGPDVVARRPIPVWRIVAAFILAAALAVIVISVARAAERNQSWDVFAFRDGRLLQADAPNIVPVQSAGPFQSKRECVDIGIQTARIRDSGWRLSCRRVN